MILFPLKKTNALFFYVRRNISRRCHRMRQKIIHTEYTYTLSNGVLTRHATAIPKPKKKLQENLSWTAIAQHSLHNTQNNDVSSGNLISMIRYNNYFMPTQILCIYILF